MQLKNTRELIVYVISINNQFENYVIWAKFIDHFYDRTLIDVGEFDRLPARGEIDFGINENNIVHISVFVNV